jgi:NADPH:quinone reductase-like Zn-dependent oxidoreductase
MRAAIVDEPNGSFRVVEVPVPTPREGEVLVRIRASGLNPLDAKIRAGAAPHARQPLPAVLGLDLAGEIVSVGPGVVDFKDGDEVYGMTGGVGGLQGSLAEYAAVDARLLAPKPRNFSMREAAVTPLVFITAWEGLVDRANVRAGQRVLVHGGAGGVGLFAVQIARDRGAKVFATASAAHFDLVRESGATAIDYRATPVENYVGRFTDGEGFDIVYDTVGGAVLDASFQAAKRFGHVVSCLGWGTHSLAPLSMKAATYSGVFTLLPLLTGLGRKHHGETLNHATELADRGLLKPNLDSRRFTLATIDDAFDLLINGNAEGKIAIDAFEPS